MQAAIMVPGREGGVWDIREVQRPVVNAGHQRIRRGGVGLAAGADDVIAAVTQRRGDCFSDARRCAGDHCSFHVLVERNVPVTSRSEIGPGVTLASAAATRVGS